MSISERARVKSVEMCASCPARHKPRSLEQHRRLFALIKAAYHHWPHGHEFKPESEEHLRKWLIKEAGRHTITTIDIVGETTGAEALVIISAAIRASGGYPFVTLAGRTARVFTPDSIAFDKLPHKEACRLFDDMAQIIEAEIGVPAERLLKEMAGAA